MRAALAYGYWGQNIGNAFFQLGGQALLRRIFGDEGLTFVQDVPAHWTLNRKSKGNPTHWWDVISRVEADYVVFQGPSLDEHAVVALDSTFSELSRRGVEPVLLSTGFMRYSEAESAAASDLIDRHGIRTVFTRDRRTFSTLGKRATYDGIDSAFYLPWAFEPTSLSTRPYVALTFERMLEPERDIANVVEGKRMDGATGSSTRPHRWPNRLAAKSQAAAYGIHTLWPRSLKTAYGEYEAVRLVHRTNPAHMAKIFRDPNTVAADEPYTYCAVYAGAEMTLTDRVHACVAALSFGRPAMMWFDTPRNALLERVGLRFPMREPQAVDRPELERERQSEYEALRDQLIGSR